MPFNDTTVLATSWLDQPPLGHRSGRTLLVGAAILAVRHRFGSWSFDLTSHSTSITDDPAATISWLADHLGEPARLLLWRAEDIAVPSLIAAATTARDTIAAAKLLRQIERAFDGEVIDVAVPHGGTKATSFDEIVHRHHLPFVPMTRDDLAEAHRTGCHAPIRRHLSQRAKSTLQLWLASQPDTGTAIDATDSWIARADHQRAAVIAAGTPAQRQDSILEGSS